MPYPYESSILHILSPNGATVGTGFVIAPNLAVTCTHVALAAKSMPGDKVKIKFHRNREERDAQVDEKLWLPAEREDIAFLRFDGSLPDGVQPVILGSTKRVSKHSFTTLGFPDTNPEGGIYGNGEILGTTRLGEIPVLQLASSEVTTGFSGAPVFDTVKKRVVGMVTAITSPDQHGKQAQTAFITPSETLYAIYPDLHRPTLVSRYYLLLLLTLTLFLIMLALNNHIGKLLSPAHVTTSAQPHLSPPVLPASLDLLQACVSLKITHSDKTTVNIQGGCASQSIAVDDVISLNSGELVTIEVVVTHGQTPLSGLTYHYTTSSGEIPENLSGSSVFYTAPESVTTDIITIDIKDQTTAQKITRFITIQTK